MTTKQEYIDLIKTRCQPPCNSIRIPSHVALALVTELEELREKNAILISERGCAQNDAAHAEREAEWLEAAIYGVIERLQLAVDMKWEVDE